MEFTLLDGQPVSLNPAAVAYFQPSGNNTLIVLLTGKSLVVREAYDAVVELANPERQAGC